MRKVGPLVLLTLLAALVLLSCGSKPTSEALAPQPTDELAAVATVEQTETETLAATATAEPTQTSAPPSPTQEAELAPTATAIPPTESVPPLDNPGLPLPTDRGQLFSASGVCTVCHTHMLDETGADVSTDTMWRASMMANAARDPYWLATVRGETLMHPEYQGVIEDKCATCHIPMAHFTVAADGGEGAVLDEGLLAEADEFQGLAIDGVSCTLCHQILEEGFGEDASFSGNFTVDTELLPGQREVFGPHPSDPGLASIMQGASGFTIVESLHVEASELCASCHTLYTPYVGADGEIAGSFPEQMAYLEWQASSFGGAISCQGCHMPVAKGGVQLSVTGGPLREPAHQHVFAGGNAYMLRVLETFGEELQVTASSAQLRDKQASVVEQLQQRTATVQIESAEFVGSELVVDLAVSSLVGHKLPTGFPSRRAWIHVTVSDGDGQVVFESGAAHDDGSIVGNDNDDGSSVYEAHYASIDSPDQVQIYETILADTEGNVTTVLLKGAEYVKDNRLLPSGFEKDDVQDDIAVHGAAEDDADFSGGGDRVRYSVDVSGAQGPYTITADLLYQSVGFRWAANLGDFDAEETERFSSYYERVANEPVLISSATQEAGD